MKKVISFVLVVAMVLGMCSMTFAAGETTLEATNDDYKVTISGAPYDEATSFVVKYDENVKLVSADWTDAYKDAVAAAGETGHVEAVNKLDGYVVFAGAAVGTTLNDDIATVEFESADTGKSGKVEVYTYTSDKFTPVETIANLTLKTYYLLGDADLDKEVTVLDALAVLKNVADSETNPLEGKAAIQANVDDDEDIDAIDALWIVEKVAGLRDFAYLDIETGAQEIANPFAGQDLSEEPTWNDADGVYSPVWAGGVSIAYWIKTNTDKATAAISFESENDRVYQKDDLAKYNAVQEAATADLSQAETYDSTNAISYKYYMPKADATYYINGAAEGEDAEPVEIKAAAPTEEGKNQSYGSMVAARPDYPEDGMYIAGFGSNQTPAWENADDVGITDPDTYVYNPGQAFWRADQFGSLELGVGRVRQCDTEGFLRMSTASGFEFCSDMGKGTQLNPNGSDFGVVKNNYEAVNRVHFDEPKTVLEKGAWHYVVLNVQNDYVQILVDGKETVNTADSNLTIWGATSESNAKLWQGQIRANLDSGLRGHYRQTTAPWTRGGDATYTTMVDWLTKPSTKLYVGGVNVDQSIASLCSRGNGDFEMANISFYTDLIDEETAAATFAAGAGTVTEGALGTTTFNNVEVE